MSLPPLIERWTHLYTQTLPTLARQRAASQPSWPVHLDHCFARIILDAVIGDPTRDRPDENPPPTPWTAVLKSPATKNMSARQLEACIELGEAIAHGGADLVALDRQSLAARGKGAKRKREGRDCTFPDAKKAQRGVVVGGQRDIRTAMGAPPPPPPTRPKSVVPSPPAAPVDEETAAKITQHPRLTPFRKRVLLALCEVPRGSYTTYLALSDFLDSSPRAVGSALRNNPFAPQVPCHRVVAADGGIGGFGGDWGVTGRHYGEKVRLLKDEGVRVDVGSGKVMGFPWTGFQ